MPTARRAVYDGAPNHGGLAILEQVSRDEWGRILASLIGCSATSTSPRKHNPLPSRAPAAPLRG
jgi:hypothetical protein